MKVYKTLLSLSLSAALFFSLTGCGGAEPSPEPRPADPVQQETPLPDREIPDTPSPEAPAPEAAGPAPQPEEPDPLAQFRQSMDQSEMLGAVLYLGWYEGDPGSEDFYTHLQADPEVTELVRDIPQQRMIRSDGYEVYCLIPADPAAAVTVSQWIIDESNDYAGAAGQILYRSDSGDPVLLLGGGEYIPALSVDLTDSRGRAVLGYTPTLSGMDGSVILPQDPATGEPLLLDCTLYTSPSLS